MSVFSTSHTGPAWESDGKNASLHKQRGVLDSTPMQRSNFIVARRLHCHPVCFLNWKRRFDQLTSIYQRRFRQLEHYSSTRYEHYQIGFPSVPMVCESVDLANSHSKDYLYQRQQFVPLRCFCWCPEWELGRQLACCLDPRIRRYCDHPSMIRSRTDLVEATFHLPESYSMFRRKSIQK